VRGNAKSGIRRGASDHHLQVGRAPAAAPSRASRDPGRRARHGCCAWGGPVRGAGQRRGDHQGQRAGTKPRGRSVRSGLLARAVRTMCRARPPRRSVSRASDFSRQFRGEISYFFFCRGRSPRNRAVIRGSSDRRPGRGDAIASKTSRPAWCRLGRGSAESSGLNWTQRGRGADDQCLCHCGRNAWMLGPHVENCLAVDAVSVPPTQIPVAHHVLDLV